MSPDRLVAPLVILDVRDVAARDANYQISLVDIARWSTQHGHVPLGAVVQGRTGWQMPELPKEPLPHTGFSTDAAEFLVRGRMVYAVGSDAPAMDLSHATDMPVCRYLGQSHIYSLANVANLD